MIEQKPIPQTTADFGTSTAHTAQSITYAAGGAAVRHSLSSICVSFTGGTPGCTLKIEDGAGTTVWEAYLATVGPHFFAFPDPLQGSPNTALILTVSDPGVSITSKLAVGGHKTV